MLGALATVATTRALANQLFGVAAVDPSTYAGVMIAMLIVSLAATLIPARRAAGIDAVGLLR